MEQLPARFAELRQPLDDGLALLSGPKPAVTVV